MSQSDRHQRLQPATKHRRATHRGFEQLNRGFDMIAAVLGLALFGPLMLMCALWIRLIDGGPVLYRQWRTGRDGWLFRIYKIRTMRLDAEQPGSARFASSGDPRVLPGCGWMRRSPVDELPQLWNILIGQMSLVGPRPERPEMIEQTIRTLSSYNAPVVGIITTDHQRRRRRYYSYRYGYRYNYRYYYNHAV